jgi:hypothetical protein
MTKIEFSNNGNDASSQSSEKTGAGGACAWQNFDGEKIAD